MQPDSRLPETSHDGLSSVNVDYRRDRWEVSLPDRTTIVCDTFDDAKRIAIRSLRRNCASELVVHDAYHRVVRHELMPARRAAPRTGS
jgi:hypothetical protein